jgi:hypothetical protein
MTKTKSAKTIASQIGDCYNQMTGYEEMLTIARKRGMEYEIERLTRQIAECEGELDYLMEDAIERGYGPEDFES